MKKQEDSKKKIWFAYVATFLIAVCIYGLRLFVTKEMELNVSDDIGALLVPASFAGRNWSDTIVSVPFYGWLYYILYTPLFLITNNPYVIYYSICIGNMLVLCSISVLIFHCIYKYLQIENLNLTLGISILCISYAVTYWPLTRNEIPALLIIWIVVYLLLKLNFYIDIPKKKNKFTIILLLVLLSSINVHTRLAIVWMALFITIILTFVIYKKWIVNPWIFTFGSVGAYWLGSVLKNFVVQYIWARENLSEIHNATVFEYGIRSDHISVQVIIDIIIGNLYKLIMSTRGIAVLVLVIVIVFIGSRLVWLKKGIPQNVKKNENIDIERALFLVSTVFLISLVATIMGLIYYYGAGITLGYEVGDENNSFKGLSYLRYYYIYFGPIFTSAIIILFKRKNYSSKYTYSSIVITVFVAFYVSAFVMPHISGRYLEFVNSSFPFDLFLREDDTYRVNFAITVVLTLILVFIWNILTKKKRLGIVVWTLVFLHTSSYISNFSNTFMNITIPSTVDSIYSVYSTLDNTINVPPQLYCLDDIKKQRDLQMVLNEYTVILGEPEEDIREAIVFTTSYEVEEADRLLRQGYKYWVLDGNECIWIKGHALQEQLEPYINRILMETKTINENNIAFGGHTSKIWNVIYQRADDMAAEAIISNPVSGDYIISLSMDTIHVPTECFGTVEVILDDTVVAKENVMLDTAGEMVLEIPVCVDNADECKIRCYFLKNTIVMDLKVATQCVNLK